MWPKSILGRNSVPYLHWEKYDVLPKRLHRSRLRRPIPLWGLASLKGLDPFGSISICSVIDPNSLSQSRTLLVLCHCRHCGRTICLQGPSGYKFPESDHFLLGQSTTALADKPEVGKASAKKPFFLKKTLPGQQIV